MRIRGDGPKEAHDRFRAGDTGITTGLADSRVYVGRHYVDAWLVMTRFPQQMIDETDPDSKRESLFTHCKAHQLFHRTLPGDLSGRSRYVISIQLPRSR